MKARPRVPFIVTVVVGVLCAAAAATALAAGLSESKKTVPLAFNEQKSVIAGCPGTKHIAFGGFQGFEEGNLSSGATKVYTYGMVPEGKDADRMVVDADNGSPPPGDKAKITSYAYCAAGKKPKIVSRDTTVDAEQESGVSATCPKGKTVIGGGFETSFENTQGPHMTITFLGRGSKESFQAQIYNTMTDDEIDLTAYAICGKGKSAKQINGPKTPVDNSGPVTTKATCPGKSKVLFGGVTGEYNLGSGVAMPTAMYRKGESIQAAGIGSYNSDSSIRAIAYCR